MRLPEMTGPYYGARCYGGFVMPLREEVLCFKLIAEAGLTGT